MSALSGMGNVPEIWKNVLSGAKRMKGFAGPASMNFYGFRRPGFTRMF